MWIPTSSSPRQSSSRGLNYLKAFGFPIKDFGNDGGGVTPERFYHPKSVIPEWFYQESKLLKGKNMDSHFLVTPAIFKPGSTVLERFGFPIKDFGNDG